MPEISSQSLEFFILFFTSKSISGTQRNEHFFSLLQTEETRTLLSVDAYSSEKDKKKRIILFVIELGFVLLLHFDAQEESMILRLATMCACVLRLACRWRFSLREADEQTNSRRWFWYIEGSAEYNHWKIKNTGKKIYLKGALVCGKVRFWIGCVRIVGLYLFPLRKRTKSYCEKYC